MTLGRIVSSRSRPMGRKKTRGGSAAIRSSVSLKLRLFRTYKQNAVQRFGVLAE